MSTAKISYNDSKRLVYLDPNSIESVGQVPVTPDYTNYSLMFRLMADVVDRMSVIGVDGTNAGKKKVGITWVSSGENGKGEKVYFTSGSASGNGGESFLTTYYTDVSYMNLSDEDVVEGLGVESIDIALENFYAASVKIRFVDVRGYGLFAREESIHSNTRLTANSVFGCFFTMPYPRFTLQVKGFYGKAVTYQLTCVGFNGSFDSESGSFIAEASFIGYDFGCLSDLPLRYVILSPFVNEIGRKYWDDHSKNDPSWLLTGPEGPEEPQMLVDVYNKIKTAILSDKSFDVTEYVEATGVVEKRVKLETLSSLKDEYSKAVLKSVTDTNGKKFYGEGVEISFTGVEETTGEILNHGRIACDITSYGETSARPVKPDFSELSRKIETFDDDYPDDVFEHSANGLDYALESVMYDNSSGRYVYAYTFKDGGLYDEIVEKILAVRTDGTEYASVTRSNGSGKDIRSILGFTPYIGNVIRLLMCHVETFIHTMYETAGNVYGGMVSGIRKGSDLGLNVLNSDMKRVNAIGVQRFGLDSEQIPPFPGIVVTDHDDDSEYFFERSGWPGDLGDRMESWEEYRLVKGYADASQRRSGSETDKVADRETGDLMCASYIFFKNVWDRWLVSGNESDFSVSNLYGRFVFIDSFYRSVEWRLHMNVDVLMDCIENKDTKNTVFTFLRELANKHNCMLFSYGDTVSFTSKYSRTNAGAIANIRDIFTPIPYKDVSDISSENRIVFMYHNRPSQSSGTGSNGFSDDNMYFSDGERLTEFANKSFASVNNSYVVPSFAVMFGKNNNTIFKRVGVNMDVPTVTNQSAESLAHVGRMLSASKRKVSFYGQDLFPVFTNYSYICELEMLGDVQITPLMYFQLFNIPVFRGVYMIFSVRHHMVNGDMTTTVKGMRMSKDAVPFPEKWFSDGYESVFARHGIYSSQSLFGNPLEIDYVKPSGSYRGFTRKDIVDIVVSLNGGYHASSENFVLWGSKSKDCYCCIVRDGLDESADFWAAIDESGVGEGETLNDNTVVSGYVEKYYTGKYDELGLSVIGDPVVCAQILAHFSVYPNVNVVSDVLNDEYGGKFITDTYRVEISQDVAKAVKEAGYEKYAGSLIRGIKYEYGKLGRNATRRENLIGRVDECTRKVDSTIGKTGSD